MPDDDDKLQQYNEAARRAFQAAREKSQEQRNADAAERARVRAQVVRDITTGERATQADLQRERYKG